MTCLTLKIICTCYDKEENGNLSPQNKLNGRK